jgi:transcriptional regulator with XRE-family HTH domain
VTDLEAKEIGRRIALARKEAGAMTQNQLAGLLNVSARSVQDYEHGITVPWRHFDRLEQIFPGKSLAWFLHGEREPPTRAEEDRDRSFRQHEELLQRLDDLREVQRVIMSRLDQLERLPRR